MNTAYKSTRIFLPFFYSICSAQNAKIIEPKDNYLIKITQQWGSERSNLGNLKTKKIGKGDIELRFWAGYGLFGTQALILKKQSNGWSAQKVKISTCSVFYPDSLEGTVSKKEFFFDLSTADCNEEKHEFGSLREVDTVLVSPIKIKNTKLRTLWTSLVKKGLLNLPTHINRNWVMTDGHGYVVELRKKNLYKVSEIEDVEEPEVKADKIVKELAELISKKVNFPFLRGPTRN